MFKADDPDTFAERIKFAVQFRKEVENNLRYKKVWKYYRGMCSQRKPGVKRFRSNSKQSILSGGTQSHVLSDYNEEKKVILKYIIYFPEQESNSQP